MANWLSLQQWQGWVSQIYSQPDQLREIENLVPSTWIKIASEPLSASISQIWEEAQTTLPRFVEYLLQSTQDLAVGHGPLGPVLLYHLKDWEEHEIGQYEQGVVIAGVPVDPGRIQDFVDTVGKLPESLVSLWRVHGFIPTKRGAILTSPSPHLEDFCGTPSHLGLRHAPNDLQDQYDCLAIGDVWKELPICLTRRPRSFLWDDFIVLADRLGQEVAPAGRVLLDDLLTDWAFSEWHPSP
jgi:hypothetical protein